MGWTCHGDIAEDRVSIPIKTRDGRNVIAMCLIMSLSPDQ